MIDHSTRDHATWSASATARNVHCAGALALAPFAPPQKESIHSARGTACHQVSEKCLRTGKDAMDFLGTVEKTKSQEIEIDEELANSAQEYVDYCRGRLAKYEAEDGTPAEFWIEEKFSLAELQPPFDAGGTGDFVIYFPDWKMIEIIDLKNGMGVVDVKDNPQLKTYGLGAMLKHQDLDVNTIKVTIVQPRAPHKDGRIRDDDFHISKLVEWTSDLLDNMKRSKIAMDEYDACNGNTVLLDEWAKKWLTPGKCTFCPVEGTCPALKRGAMAVAALWFDDFDQPRIGNSALETDPESMARDLDMIPMLEDWIKARRAFAHSQAESGVEIPGYQLADKIGNRKWNLPEASIAEALKQEAGLTEADIHVDPKVKSPAQIEKVLGGKRKALIEPFVTREVTGTNLVSVSATSRPAAKTTVDKFFQQ